MFTRTIILALLILFSASPLYGQGRRSRTSIMHDGIGRNYITYVPSSYDPAHPMPLVLNFHGLTSAAFAQEFLSGMNAIAEREGFLLAYPDAVDGDWRISNDHNINFVETLLDALAADYTVDTQRVYATGASQGAIMSFVLAAALPDRFAAIASLAGSRLVSGAANRHPAFLANTPDRPFPLLYIHGTADTGVPYDGGRSSSDEPLEFSPVSEILAEWVDSNGGTSLEPAATILGFDVTDGSEVSLFQCTDCESYLNAAGDELPAEVIHMRVNGLGHEYPATDVLDVSSETWNFFSRHELAAVVPEPTSLGLALALFAGVAGTRRGFRVS